MGRIAGFTQKTTSALEKRAANQCSFPGCEAVTSGPSSESDIAVSNSGTACHIYAASDGPAARRVGHSMSVDQLKHINNGIWMCATHGRLIDTDECTYTPQTLMDWRRIAERKTSLLQSLGADKAQKQLREERLAEISTTCRDSEISFAVNKFIEESCLSSLWGKDTAYELRNFIIEIARNSFSHGGASNFVIFSSGHTVTIRSDGDQFSLSDLERSQEARGGSQALSELKNLPINLLVSHKHTEDENIISITLSGNAKETLIENPCTVMLGFSDEEKDAALSQLDQLSNCDRVFVIAPHFLLSYSDLHAWKTELETRAKQGRKVCLVIQEHSDSLMRQMKLLMPNVEVIVSEM